MKRLFFFYQRAMWYAAQAKAEIGKPLLVVNETLWLTTWMAIVLAYRPPLVDVLGVYFLVLVVFIIVGKILVKMGAVSYTNTIANQENHAIMEILTRVGNIERKLDDGPRIQTESPPPARRE